ncbi:PH domain-containing protein [Radicibacter daui]|uniref:PH domain-containing protein n=1 Tax=Radicibacter daui TaxID=3064829 RepID=UPI004046A1D8
MPAPQRLLYPAADLTGDYLRAGAGLLLTLVPLVAVDMLAWVRWVFIAAALLFAIFALRTAQRQLTVVALDDTGIEVKGPLGRKRLEWAALQKLKLAYYSTRRDRQGGWMQLDLTDAKGRLRVESQLLNFDRVVEAAAAAALANRLTLTQSTRANLLSLGFEVPEGGPLDD